MGWRQEERRRHRSGSLSDASPSARSTAGSRRSERRWRGPSKGPRGKGSGTSASTERERGSSLAQWNQTDKTLQTKIVYWGTALGGKTTNLQQIHAITDPEGENRLISLNTSSDRTLFFDLLPLDLGRIFGHALKIQLYTVPGQVRYDATRRVVLSGADAVVFVADSQRGRGAENRAAWENLRANMKAIGLDPLAVPAIVQY